VTVRDGSWDGDGSGSAENFRAARFALKSRGASTREMILLKDAERTEKDRGVDEPVTPEEAG
jgi:hypothetical protein